MNKELKVSAEAVMSILKDPHECSDVKRMLTKIFGDQLEEATVCYYQSGSIFLKTDAGYSQSYAMTHMNEECVRRNLFILIHKEKSQEYGLRNLFTGQSIQNYTDDPIFRRVTKGLISIPRAWLNQRGLKFLLGGSMS